VGLTKGRQDAEDEARMLRRQRVQMFRRFAARLMEATRRLGIEGLVLPSVPEDDGAILCFFGQLADKLVEASAKVAELIDTECWELLALVGTRIFSNIQRLHPKLDLEELLQMRTATPPGNPDRAAQARVARLDISLHRLQAIYARPTTSSAVGQESSSSDEGMSSGESSSEEASEFGNDGAMEPSREASSGSSQGTGDDEGFEDDAL
jgi:hypothetical protein